MLDYYANGRGGGGGGGAVAPFENILTISLSMTDNNNNNASSSTNNNDNEIDAFGGDLMSDWQPEFVTENPSLTISGHSTSVTTMNGDDGGGTGGGATVTTTEMPVWLIPSYSVILLCAVVGNLLVVLTLIQNRRMRTVTNLFLLNLAISDMLLGVLCMPVTLVGTLLRTFIFGEFLCKLIQFSQAASVAVSSWTLVAISCERYYAICHPLRSRSWQTISHAYKIIGFIWLGGILCMTPIAVFSQLIPTSRAGYCKCREHWPDLGYERFYNILLDLFLLVLPLIILCVAYILIIRSLYVGMGSRVTKVSEDVASAAVSVQGIQGQVNGSQAAMQAQSSATNSGGAGGTAVPTCVLVVGVSVDYIEKTRNNNNAAAATATATVTATPTSTPPGPARTNSTVTMAKMSPSLKLNEAALRRSNETKTLESKKRVVKMLFVLVLEFFICWTPLYVINTLGMFIGPALYEYIDYTTIGFLQLLAYSSSCCNPITYCFMNAGFRRAFVDTFKGLPWWAGRHNHNHTPGHWRSHLRHEMVSLSVGAATVNSTAPGATTAPSPRL